MASPTNWQFPSKQLSPQLILTGLLIVAVAFGLPRLMTITPSTSNSVEMAKGSSKVTLIEGPSIATSLARLLGSFLLVVGLCVIIARVVQKRESQPSPNLNLLASLVIAPQCVIQLVKAGDRRLILGIDGSGVKSILELPRVVTEHAIEEAERTAKSEKLLNKQPASYRDWQAPIVVGPISQTVSAPTIAEIELLLSRRERDV